MDNKIFEKCNHNWVFHFGVDIDSGPAKGNSIFRCSNCEKIITLTEKSSLDQTEAQRKSLSIQERHTKIGMIANIFSAITLIVAVLALFFGN